ncbi:MAG: sulfur oxidation c-type cytochrome SoxX, partial [Gemmobacter sp.]
MRQGILGTVAVTVALAAAASLAGAAETPPAEVAFHDGAIEQSLTGVPGDPAAGEKVMTTAALGNCLACHQSEALGAYPFQGNIAPPLDGVAERWTEAELRGIVVNAKMTFDESFMPAFYKTTGVIRPGDGYKGTAAPADMPPILTAQQV